MVDADKNKKIYEKSTGYNAEYTYVFKIICIQIKNITAILNVLH